MELLRKKDLHPNIGVPKSTVADWIEDFNVYIPKTKQGNTIYYRPEAIDVLKFIKQCRENHYQKNQIMEMLADKGFPITVEEAVEDVKRALEGDTPRDNLITIMQTMGQAVVKIAEQDERLEQQDESIESLRFQQDGQVERLNDLEKQTNEIDNLKLEFEKIKQELAATKEDLKQEKNKGFFAKLFGKI